MTRTSSMQSIALRATVFYTGAVILAVEVMAVRVLSPYFGNTVFNFSSVISVILAALSLGYWYGGTLADRRPSGRLFYGLVILAGIMVLASYALAAQLLPTVGTFLPTTIGPLLAALVLFFPPGFVFGLLSPFVIKLASVLEPGKGVGTIAGEIFFFSTVGSIAGSLMAGFVLVPQVGISSSMIVMGVSLVLFGLVGLWRADSDPGRAVTRMIGSASLLVVIVCGVLIYTASPTYAGVHTLYEKDGVYGRIVIAEGIIDGKVARTLHFDRSYSSAVFIDDPTTLPFPYMNFFSLYKAFDTAPERVLVLGSAVGAVPKVLLRELPQATIDAVEIEPALPRLGEEYFGTPRDPRLHTYIEDGRRFLASRPDARYEVIVGDAYHSFYSIPWHMATREFYGEVYSHMTDGGVYLMNVISMRKPEEPTMLFSTVATMDEVFDSVHVFAVQNASSTTPQNFIVVGTKGAVPDLYTILVSSANPSLRQFAAHYVDLAPYRPLAAPILTDDYAPVDTFTARLLVESEF